MNYWFLNSDNLIQLNIQIFRVSLIINFPLVQIQDNHLKNYGLATWLCFRAKPDEDKIHLNLQKCLDIAEEIGGKNTHGFRYIQVPMGIGMPEAFTEQWQEFCQPGVANEVKELKILVSVCNLLKMNVIVSKPLLEGRIHDVDIPYIQNIQDPVAKHLQLVRSLPPRCIISTLVGMKRIDNLKKNFEVIKCEPLTREEFTKAMKPPK